MVKGLPEASKGLKVMNPAKLRETALALVARRQKVCLRWTRVLLRQRALCGAGIAQTEETRRAYRDMIVITRAWANVSMAPFSSGRPFDSKRAMEPFAKWRDVITIGNGYYPHSISLDWYC